MFLTRAAQIIGKEGFKTFGYALQQKMHQNMTDLSEKNRTKTAYY